MQRNSLFKKLLVCFVLMIFGLSTVQAQYSSIDVGKKQKAYRDSLKTVKYDYIFPIWGQKVYEKGFDIPYPVGMMVNYLWMKQDLIIDNMQLGLKTGDIDLPLTPVEFIEFGVNTSTINSYNFRPDVWVLPFLNVYGLFGGGVSETIVNLVAPINLQSIVEQKVSTKGVGVMGAGGVGKYWFSVDGNWTWSKPELLDEAVRVNVLGVRWGRTFNFKNKPESNFAFWAGGMRTKMESETRGELTLSEAIPGLADRADQIVDDYNVWYDGLTPQQQIAVNLTPIPDIVDRIDATDGSAIIRYGMDKQVKQLWNGIIGAQYQYNKRWMIRSEAGIVGNRKSLLVSINYRFLM